MRAGYKNEALQMLDLLLKSFADGALDARALPCWRRLALPNRHPRLSTSQAPRLDGAQSWLRCARRPAPLALMIPSQGQG